MNRPRATQADAEGAHLPRATGVAGHTNAADIDRRRELRLATFQSLALLLIFTAAIISLHPGLRLGTFLLLGSIFLIVYRAWALDRFSPGTAGIYARIFATDYLTHILRALGDDPDLRPLLGNSAAACDHLARASSRAREDATSILRAPGYPSRQPIPLISLLGTLISFALGALLGAWLPTTSLSTAFTSLCDTRSVIGALAAPWLLLLQGPVLFAVAAVIVIKVYAVINNRAQVQRAHEFFARNAHGELRGVLTGPYSGRRRALLHDIDLLARMAGASKSQADAVLEAYGVDITPPGSGKPAWHSIRLSTVNELSKNQALFVVGLYLGLALPSLLHIGSATCH